MVASGFPPWKFSNIFINPWFILLVVLDSLLVLVWFIASCWFGGVGFGGFGGFLILFVLFIFVSSWRVIVGGFVSPDGGGAASFVSLVVKLLPPIPCTWSCVPYSGF